MRTGITMKCIYCIRHKVTSRRGCAAVGSTCASMKVSGKRCRSHSPRRDETLCSTSSQHSLFISRHPCSATNVVLVTNSVLRAFFSLSPEPPPCCSPSTSSQYAPYLTQLCQLFVHLSRHLPVFIHVHSQQSVTQSLFHSHLQT